MSKLQNAPLVEVIFELKWGKTTKKKEDILIEFSQEELELMPGKFQLAAEEEGLKHFEILQNQPPIPHLVRYRFRKKSESYPLYQLGNGILAINQTDFDGNEYDWDNFKLDIKTGLSIFEKSYPFSISQLPLIDLQIRYRDVVEANENQNSFQYIKDNLDIGSIQLPSKLKKNSNFLLDTPSSSIIFEVDCKNPSGKFACQISDGYRADKKSFIIDFIINSKIDSFPDVSIDSLMNWCKDAHDRHREAFNAIFNEKALESFK